MVMSLFTNPMKRSYAFIGTDRPGAKRTGSAFRTAVQIGSHPFSQMEPQSWESMKLSPSRKNLFLYESGRLTRVDQRDPYKLFQKMRPAQLQA